MTHQEQTQNLFTSPSGEVISGIQSQDIPKVWNKVAPRIIRVLKKTRGEHSIWDYYNYLMNGVCQLWVAHKDDEISCVMVTQIARLPQFNIGEIVLTEGAAGPVEETFIKLFSAYAKEHGCKEIHVQGRKGWQKRLSKYGFEPVYTTLAMELRDEQQEQDERSDS